MSLIKNTSKINFSIGNPLVTDYDILLDEMAACMHLNSVKTSTVPLVQFWQDTSKVIQFLESEIRMSLPKPQLCFEYPVQPQGGKGKCSMTDLMLLSQDDKIAIEAKYTEYVEALPSTVKTVAQWNKDNTSNKKGVANGWYGMVKPFRMTPEECPDSICYQFLHRTASACWDTKGQAVVIYQVFYDKEKENLAEYKQDLQNCVNIICPNDKLRFYIWEIEATLLTPITAFPEKNGKIEPNPFDELKSKRLYAFNELGNIYPMK